MNSTVNFTDELKKMIGLGPVTGDPTEVAFRNFQRTAMNPFPTARERIQSLMNELDHHAGQGDHFTFDGALRSLLSELTLYNSNVSRFVVTPIKERLDRENKKLMSAHADRTYREHNRLYIQVRSEIKNLQDVAPLADKKGGDVAVDKSTTQQVALGCLANIRKATTRLQAVWSKLMRYEEMIYEG